jgi:NADH-quinone oxidoreductase subunit J
MVDTIVFLVAAAICLSGAFGVILAKNPVHAALMLVMTLFGIAVQFVALEAHFLAAVQVIVYAGAIVVLFLFVIMLLGVDVSQRLEFGALPGQRVAAFGFAGAGLAILGFLINRVDNPATGARAVGGAIDPETTNVSQLAGSLFDDYVYAFELTSVLLVIAVIGAVVLARKPTGGFDDDGFGEPNDVAEGSEA